MEDLRNRFIVNEKMEEKKMRSYVERLLSFCKVTEEGGIIFDDKVSTSLDKVGIALTARFLANSLEKGISPIMTAEELSKSLNIPKDQIYARIKDLKKKKFIANAETGGYEVKPLEIGKFLSEIEKKYGVSKK